MAIDSARSNFRAAFGISREAEFRLGDCLEGITDGSADLVLVNPPFHQHHSIGDRIARNMFRDARRVLSAGGELRVVGNRHLGYHARLGRLFGNCETVASDSKFVILSATKSA
jgi:16S rRNA (guanine1207-N2)-methyltransferase